MSGKHHVSADEGPKDTDKGKRMSVLQKLEGLEELQRGMITAVVSCHYSVHESITHYIKKIETKPEKCVTISSVSHHDPLFKN
jgi:hypothetical protein